jgi:signal transduction histidine kinase
MDSAQLRFLATMSHELRTPLNVVIGYSEVLQTDPDMASGQIVEFANAINDAGRQLLNLVDVILDVARGESGTADLTSDLIDVGRMVRSGAAQASGVASAGKISLSSDVPAGLPLLRGDERRMRDALRHLIANAVKFTQPGGAVRVAARLDKKRGDLLLLVSDTGIGIAPDDMGRVFQPFLQLDDSLDRRFPGSGLGLYVSLITARAHGGDLVLRSDVGVGTTAILRLPALRLLDTPPY